MVAGTPECEDSPRVVRRVSNYQSVFICINPQVCYPHTNTSEKSIFIQYDYGKNFVKEYFTFISISCKSGHFFHKQQPIEENAIRRRESPDSPCLPYRYVFIFYFITSALLLQFPNKGTTKAECLTALRFLVYLSCPLFIYCRIRSLSRMQ